jgi:hypothetical protein
MPKHPSSSRSLRTVLDNRALPAYIRSLSPGALARICSRIGVSDAAQVMALAPASQLIRALDASVWKTPRPGLPEAFDPHELMEWLAVWLDIGEEFTAERLGAIPEADLTLYLSHVMQVATLDMWGFERSTEIGDLERIYAPSYHENAYGPYVVTASSAVHWETLRAALDAFWQHSPERLLHLFSQLVGDESMLAPQARRESSNEDLSADRVSAQERKGHVSALGARAFLDFAATTPLEELLSLSQYDLETRRHLSGIDSVAAATQEGDPQTEPPSGESSEAGLTVLHEELIAAGWIEPPPQRLLLTQDARRTPLPVVQLLSELAQRSPESFDARGRELAYLAGVLIAGVAVNGEMLSAEDARGAALATCNLGMGLLEKQGQAVRIDEEPGLVRLFLVGWQGLGQLPARLVETLSRSLAQRQAAALRDADRWMLDDATSNLADVRAALAKRQFAAAREAALLLSFVFDRPACRAVVALLDELPRLQDLEGREAPRWIESLADLQLIAGYLKRIAKRPRPSRA